MSLSPLRQGLGLLLSCLLTLSVGALGALGSLSARELYQGLQRPEWAPPGWLFGPVWTTLYLAMGVAAWLVWRRAGFTAARGPLVLFLLHLLPNALWSWLFFAWQQGAWAMVDILLLWGLIVALLWQFGRLSRPAAWLLAPYLAWVTFASALCYAVWQANPAAL